MPGAEQKAIYADYAELNKIEGMTGGQAKARRGTWAGTANVHVSGRRENAQKLVELFGYFTRPFDLEVAQGIEAGEDAFSEAVAKIVATRQLAAERTEAARPSSTRIPASS